MQMSSQRIIWTTALFLVGTVGILQPLNANDWTRFRGPNGSGVAAATELPTEWTEADYNWRVELPGEGHSCPVIWDDQVFLLSASRETATRYVICLGTETGEERWRREFTSESHKIHARNTFASATPAVDADHVYVAWSTPEKTSFIAFDHTGEIQWEHDLGPFASSHGFGTSPIVFKDLVILCLQQRKPDRNGPRIPSSSIVAVDRKSGEIRWQTERLSEVVSYAVPCIYTPPTGDPELICMSTAHGIFSLDPESGEENWAIEVFDKRTVSSPIIVDGLIFGTTGSGGGGNYVVAVQPEPRPELAYEIKRQAPYVPCPVAKDGLLFLWSDKGIVTCVRAETGEQIWQQRVGGNYSGSPIIASDHLYCIDEDGVVVVLAAADEFKLVGKNPLGEGSRSTPAVADHRLYLRTYSHLVSIGGK